MSERNGRVCGAQSPPVTPGRPLWPPATPGRPCRRLYSSPAVLQGPRRQWEAQPLTHLRVPVQVAHRRRSGPTGQAIPYGTQTDQL